MRNFTAYMPRQILFGYSDHDHEMGKTRGIYGGEEKCMHGLQSLKERDNLEDLGVVVDVILKYSISHTNRMGWHGPD
jgi:hypothetical protein